MGSTQGGSDLPNFSEEQRLLARLAGFASGANTGGSAVPTEAQRQISRLERSLKMVRSATRDAVGADRLPACNP